MAKRSVPLFLRGYVGQSAANTYVEKEIDTNLNAAISSNVMYITSIVIERFGSLAAANEEISLQLTKDSFGSMQPVHDSSVIWAYKHRAAGANIGVEVMVAEFEIVMPVPVLGSIYLGLNTTALAIPETVSYRLGYELQKVTQAEMVRLLAAS